MRTARLLLAALLLAATPVAAQTEASRRDTVYTMSEITVTALRTEASPALVAQRVTVLDREAISSSGSRSLADLLSKRTGLFVRRYGDGLATISARGASPSQSLILIDGLRLTDPQLGQFDVSLLPTYLLQSVEVLHGPSSALYGSDGMAATVNLRRLRPQADHLALGSDFGAYGERRAFASTSFRGARIGGVVAGEVGVSEGDFPYLNDALFPAREMRRQNADREKRSVFASLEATEGRHTLQGAFVLAAAEQGLPGLSTTPSQGERQWDRHLRFWLSDAVPVSRGLLRLRGFVHRGSIRYVNPLLDIDDESRTLAGSLEGEASMNVGSSGTLSGGAVAGFASAEHPSLSGGVREFHAATFLSATAVVGPIRVYPALRGDTYFEASGDSRASLNPRLGLNLQPFGGFPLFVKANVGRAYRHPTFNDRFWQPGGNPELRAERSWSYEAGVFVDAGPQVELTYYESRITDQITWQPRLNGIWTPDNIARSHIRGIEASGKGRHRFGDGGTVEGGLFYTWTHATDRSEAGSSVYGKQLRYVPRMQM
ncbi:MAG: TonB-dependent receptor, partial [Rhodothermales bacterium]